MTDDDEHNAANPMTVTQLEAIALNLWRGDAWLVRDLTFSVQASEFVHVSGPNGAGKTTLLRALGGLMQPESGEVRWRGAPIGADPLAFHAELAWLGHRDGLKPELTVRENLQAYARMGGVAPARLEEALRDAGIADSAGLQARLLSAGQQRRAALARVFASPVPLWILDEPLANLDTAGRDWALARITAHVAEGGIAVVTSHLPLEHPRLVRIELGAS